MQSACKYCDKQELKEASYADEDTSCECQPVRVVRTHQMDGDNDDRGAALTVEELKNAQKNDVAINSIFEWMDASPERPAWSSYYPAGITMKILWAQWDSLCQVNGILYRNWEDLTGRSCLKQLVLPKDLREEVVKDLHCSPMSGHLGVNKTLSRVKKRFYWPKCRNDVTRVCKQGDQCESRKPLQG